MFTARKRRIRSVICSTAAIGLATVTSDPAWAQAEATDVSASETASLQESPGLQEIVVTAQKRSENVNKVGISIDAITGDALQNMGISNAADLVKVVPGFNFTPSPYGPPVYTLRGIGFYDTSLSAAPTVSVYVDEVPLPLSLMSTGASLDLQRVEVLKGPQGTLFGQNSTGGAINYIAAKPTDYFKMGSDFTVGRFNKVETKGFVSGPLSKTLRARIALRYDHGGNWQKSYTRNDSLGKSDLLVGRLLLEWTPSDRLTLMLNVNGWSDHSDTQAAQLVQVVNTSALISPRFKNYPTPPSNDNRIADWDPDKNFRRDVRFWQTSLRADYELNDDLTLTSISAYEELNRDGLVDADGTAAEGFTVQTPGHSKDFSQELRATGQLDALKFVIGGNFASDRITDANPVLVAESSFPFDSARAQAYQKVSTTAIFGNIDYSITDTVTLQAGARYTKQKRDFQSCSYDSGTGDAAAVLSALSTRLSGTTVIIPPGGCITLNAQFLPAVTYDQLDEDNISWRGGVNWEVTPRALLYANISKGYKSGSFPTAGATTSAQLVPARQESVLAYEAGFKLTMLERTLQLNGAAFYYDYSNKQLRGKVIDPVIGPLNALVNVPKARVQGAELKANWNPLRGLNINLGGTYVDSKIKGSFTNFDALGTRRELAGNPFPLTPKWQVVGDAQYEFDLNGSLGAFIGGAVNYQGSTNSGLGGLPLFSIASYTLFDARVGLKSQDDRWRLTAFVQNVTNKNYSTLVNLVGPDAVVRYQGRPRTWGLTLSLRQ
jgi:outer membrane receptor protein involved in Fe transport